MVEEELVEVSVFHVFHDHTHGFLSCTYTHHTDNVWVLQHGHDLHLTVEIRPEKDQRDRWLLRREYDGDVVFYDSR